ncbi:MAG: hypothetical protein OEY13_09105 [Gammaproteobacteria bacterium]|nr:hypothetical protein [Gammaproteobacteria bacterium]MDH4311297.1 hypothetical protein [Gammaproteobacteria bacterium]MDH5273220.1 hypothetical protein [Gammaproteobacteria bacterium]
MSRPLYEHTQTGWPIRIAFLALAFSLLLLAALPDFDQTRTPPTVLAAGAGIAALFGWVWGSMTVRIQDGALCIRFGPGWPRKTVPLADISGVEITRTSFIDGWGVHRTRRGWLYNVSGYDAVLLKLASGRNLLVGSDEPRRLQAALQRAAARA